MKLMSINENATTAVVAFWLPNNQTVDKQNPRIYNNILKKHLLRTQIHI